MSLWRGYLLWSFFFELVACGSNLFTSTHDMQKPLVTESLAYEDAIFFLWLEERRLRSAVLQYKQILERVSRLAGQDVLRTFLLLSRLTSLYSCPTFRASHRRLRHMATAFGSPSFEDWWPTEGDLSGAATGICILQQVYDIEVSRMAAMMSRLLPRASPEDLVAVARGCFAAGPFGNVSEWSQTALDSPFFMNGVLHSKMMVGLRWLQDNDLRSSLLRQTPRCNVRRPPYPEPPATDVSEYKPVCKQEADLRYSAHHLVCKMSTNFGDPELLLQPLKIEVLSLKPRIVLLNKFLSQVEIDSIRDAARNGLRRSGVYTGDGPHGSTSWKRTSKVGTYHVCNLLTARLRPLLLVDARKLSGYYSKWFSNTPMEKLFAVLIPDVDK